MGFDLPIIIISLVFMGIGGLVSSRLKSKFNEYSQIPIKAGLSGREIAEKMLRENGIHDVSVVSVPGFLSDHYNPAKKTVNLSPEVYEGRSVSAAAVSAHECGHAIQHQQAYAFLQMRSSLVPIVNVSSRLSNWIIMAGLVLMAMSGNTMVLLAGIILFATTTLFTVITLPVEFDASNRALAWLNRTNITFGDEHEKAKDALKWAAMTYVVAALSSIAILLRYVMLFLSRRD
ncbi:MAG: zinc metallopeptidase [Chitinophagales bacterium]|nr:zinc metallopeptidase [Chitinophagales bacterium]